MKQARWIALTAISMSVTFVAACQLVAPTGTRAGDKTLVNGSGSATLNGSARQMGNANVVGKVTDTTGRPVANATVYSGPSKTFTDANGNYSLKVNAGSVVNVKAAKAGYILRDGVVAAFPSQTLTVNIALKQVDSKVTRISAAKGGIAVSSDGLVAMHIPPGALTKDADVRVTWLDPTSSPTRPSGFRIASVDGPTADYKVLQTAEATPTATPTPKLGCTIGPDGQEICQTGLNDTELPGPLETYAYEQTRKFFSPVSFADVQMSEPLKEGETAKLYMRISDEVLTDMIEGGDLKIKKDLGKEIFPCFFWNDDPMDPAATTAQPTGWDKPALSSVLAFEKDSDTLVEGNKADPKQHRFFFAYTVRDTNMELTTSTAYRTLQIGDGGTTNKVELIVGGGRRVVDAAGVIGALIERSSDVAFDLKGITTTLTAANYYSSAHPNLVRPDVPTQNYEGTAYAEYFDAETWNGLDASGEYTTEDRTAAQVFEKWAVNDGAFKGPGAFSLLFPTNAPYTIVPPTYLGVTPSQVNGTTNTPSPADCVTTTNTDAVTGEPYQTTTCPVPPGYVKPIFYYTDSTVNINLTGPETAKSAKYTVEYQLNGKKLKQEISFPLKLTVPRNATGTGQTFVLDLVYNDLLTSEKGNLYSGSLLPGTLHNTTIPMKYSQVGK